MLSCSGGQVKDLAILAIYDKEDLVAAYLVCKANVSIVSPWSEESKLFGLMKG